MTCLAGCAPTTEYVEIPVDVPRDLRTPHDVKPRAVDGLKDVGLVLADYVEGYEANRGKVVAIDCILTAAERGETDIDHAECAR